MSRQVARSPRATRPMPQAAGCLDNAVTGGDMKHKGERLPSHPPHNTPPRFSLRQMTARRGAFIIIHHHSSVIAWMDQPTTTLVTKNVRSTVRILSCDKTTILFLTYEFAGLAVWVKVEGD